MGSTTPKPPKPPKPPHNKMIWTFITIITIVMILLTLLNCCQTSMAEGENAVSGSVGSMWDDMTGCC